MTTTVIGWVNLKLQLYEARLRLRDPGPALLGPVADGVRESFANQFQSTGGYGGSPWKPLAASTAQRTGRWVPLQATGTLWRSLAVKGAPHGYAELRDPWTLAVGTTDPVAPFHQLGTRKMPKRPLVPPVIPDADRDRWASLAVDYILEGHL